MLRTNLLVDRALRKETWAFTFDTATCCQRARTSRAVALRGSGEASDSVHLPGSRCDILPSPARSRQSSYFRSYWLIAIRSFLNGKRVKRNFQSGSSGL